MDLFACWGNRKPDLGSLGLVWVRGEDLINEDLVSDDEVPNPRAMSRAWFQLVALVEHSFEFNGCKFSFQCGKQCRFERWVFSEELPSAGEIISPGGEKVIPLFLSFW